MATRTRVVMALLGVGIVLISLWLLQFGLVSGRGEEELVRPEPTLFVPPQSRIVTDGRL